MRISQAQPGQLFRHDMSAEAYVFIGIITPHPLYPKFSLVIWWTPKKGYSMDALNPEMDLDTTMTYLQEQSAAQQYELLKLALTSAQGGGGVI